MGKTVRTTSGRKYSFDRSISPSDRGGRRVISVHRHGVRLLDILP